jgi:hypothetical protein
VADLYVTKAIFVTVVDATIVILVQTGDDLNSRIVMDTEKMLASVKDVGMMEVLAVNMTLTCSFKKVQ